MWNPKRLGYRCSGWRKTPTRNNGINVYCIFWNRINCIITGTFGWVWVCIGLSIYLRQPTAPIRRGGHHGYRLGYSTCLIRPRKLPDIPPWHFILTFPNWALPIAQSVNPIGRKVKLPLWPIFMSVLSWSKLVCSFPNFCWACAAIQSLWTFLIHEIAGTSGKNIVRSLDFWPNNCHHSVRSVVLIKSPLRPFWPIGKNQSDIL
jgi:hypothetical protein